MTEQRAVEAAIRESEARHRALLEALPQLADIREHLWIVHQTGSSDFAIAQATYAKGPYPGVVHAYIQDMAQEYGAADLVICRAGATTIAELTVTGKAAVLVPFPYATHHHQEHNARTLAAVVWRWASPMPPRKWPTSVSNSAAYKE